MNWFDPPIHTAAYRGAVLGFLMHAQSGDYARGLGAGTATYLIAMGLFKAEEGIIRKFAKRNGECPSPQKMNA